MAKQVGVYHPGYDKILWHVHREEARNLVRQGTASWYEHGIRLSETGIRHDSRTRISSGGIRAAIGMSQDYTARSPHGGRVTGFKTIDAVDRCVFHTATLECMSAAT